MANLRRHFRVAWNGGEPVDIVTNARDIAEAAELEASKVTTGFAVVYSALQRNGLEVPPTLDEFIDQLDDMSGNANGSAEPANPTQPQVSTEGPLP
jgi:hypothetical protein